MGLLKKRIYFEPGGERLFAGLHLDDYDAVMDFSGGRLVAQNPGKTIRVLEEKSDHGLKRYYLKQVISQRTPELLKSVFKPKPMRIITSRERHLLKFLKKQGIPVMETAAWGTKEIFGIPLGGFLLVEEVKGKDFVDVYGESDRAARNRMMEGYGRLAGHMHRKGLDSLVRVTDIICVSDDFRDFKKSMVLIDREWGALEIKTFSFDERCYQLGKMFVKMVRFIGMPKPDDVIHFMKGYKKESPGYHHAAEEILSKSEEYASKMIKGKYREQELCRAVKE
jgi:hypothetical protein